MLLPIIDSLIATQRAVLSPNQCPAYFPLPGKVERDKTIERPPVVSLAALIKIIFLNWLNNELLQIKMNQLTLEWQ